MNLMKLSAVRFSSLIGIFKAFVDERLHDNDVDPGIRVRGMGLL